MSDPDATATTTADDAVMPPDCTPINGDISQWPDALLLCLFEGCSTVNTREKPYRIITPISQTYRNWRRVALANTKLWWDVYLGLDDLDQGMAFLSKAVENNLISVYISSAGSKMTRRKLDRLGKAISETQKKWAYVMIEEDCSKRLALLVHAVFSSRRWTTSLQRLKLVHSGLGTNTLEDLSPVAGLLDVGGRGIPNLHLCRIWKFPLIWLNFRAHSLTELDLRHITHQFFPSWHGFAALINAAPSLEHLILIGIEMDLAPGCVPYPPLEVTKLKSLTLRLHRENGISSVAPIFLRGIRVAPALVTLIVSDLDGLTGFVPMVFSSRERRFPSLASLSLLYADLSEEIPDPFFTATAGLKELHVVKSSGTYHNILNKVRGEVWPNLEKIVLVKGDDTADHSTGDVVGWKEIAKRLEIVHATDVYKIRSWELAGHTLERPEHLFRYKSEDST